MLQNSKFVVTDKVFTVMFLLIFRQYWMSQRNDLIYFAMIQGSVIPIVKVWFPR